MTDELFIWWCVACAYEKREKGSVFSIMFMRLPQTDIMKRLLEAGCNVTVRRPQVWDVPRTPVSMLLTWVEEFSEIHR